MRTSIGDDSVEPLFKLYGPVIPAAADRIVNGQGTPEDIRDAIARAERKIREYDGGQSPPFGLLVLAKELREMLPVKTDHRDARIAALEGENAALKGRLRETCQILVESVGGLGPCDAEDAARRAAQVVDQLRAQLAASCEPFPWKRLGCVYSEGGVTSVIAARDEDGIGVVASWDLGRDGVWRLCGWGCTEDHEGPDDGEEPLPETPPACLLTIPGKTPEPAPLRLGRGPTVEEAKAHADAQEDGHGWWLVSFDVRRHPDDEAIYFEIASIEVEDGEVFVDGMSSADGSRYTEITDAIPLNASRQPCGVGVTTHPEDSIGVRMIAAERQRQMTHEGWTPAHDDEHAAGEMASAAACYAGQVFTPTREPPPNWPWERRWWKPKGGRIRVLAKAGALIAAEIDRLSRVASRQPCGVGVKV